jgi:hypothetical protein
LQVSLVSKELDIIFIIELYIIFLSFQRNWVGQMKGGLRDLDEGESEEEEELEEEEEEEEEKGVQETVKRYYHMSTRN